MITRQQVCFIPNGAIGDIFVVAGAANWYSERCDRLYFPVDKRLGVTDMVKCLFKENKKIAVIEYEDTSNYADLNHFIHTNQLTIFVRPKLVTVQVDTVECYIMWDEQLYTSFDLPFSVRYSHFKLPDLQAESIKLYKSIVTNPRYILISRKISTKDQAVDIDLISSRAKENLDSIDNFQVIELTEDITDNILLYSELIKHAEEIHCVPSSVFCFVDSITQTTSAKLFYHDIRANTIMRVNNNWNNNRWNIIKYDRKL